MFTFVPQGPGLLPKWMLLVSGLAFFNTVQNYVSTKLTSRLYNASAVSGLSSRLFGLWTLVSALVRLQAAYNIHDRQAYNLALATYVIVVFHYLSEWLVYKTTKMSAALASPMIVGTTSLIWMVLQYNYYVG